MERQDREDGIAILTLNRPDRLNALDVSLVAELHAALDRIEGEDNVRVVILTGAGRAFCAGLDLNGYGDDDRVEREGLMISTFGRQRDIAGLVQRIRRLRTPVIAAVNGAAAGGGLALVCAADVRVATTDSVFAVSFIRAGYSACDIGVSWMLPRLVGVARAHELMLTGRRFEAAEAREIGLVTQLVDPGTVIDAALGTAEQILMNPPLSVELTKVGMWAAVETPSFDVCVEFENRQQMVAALTEDCAEATAAFLSKRAPMYSRR
ncbi:enoyl-CoA hydratase/isomerase family protein [Rhodococcus qingshengii]|uniref:enoyl-CoA hydratase/isomerase family protein n=1 Tax=Rhodococcus qingshengii TaxID=334542 RepID=UPI00237CD729|nr:enoyl-CoA hydratase/isomerase family protein [Rhodococcus qingshengii]WCT06047.1 enoyl-CoA hydratase/isomerase family protein [Rhodococcus qingshengii]